MNKIDVVKPLDACLYLLLFISLIRIWYDYIHSKRSANKSITKNSWRYYRKKLLINYIFNYSYVQSVSEIQHKNLKLFPSLLFPSKILLATSCKNCSRNTRSYLHGCANRDRRIFIPRASINKKSCTAGRVEGHRSFETPRSFKVFSALFRTPLAGELIFVIYSASRGVPLYTFSTLHPVSLIFLLTLFLT